MGSLRALDDQSQLDRFIQIKAEIKRLEEQLEPLKDAIFYALEAEPEKKCSHFGCDLTVQYRTTYEYTPETQLLEQQLKAKKEYEEAAGEAAIVRQTGYVVVKAAKVQPF